MKKFFTFALLAMTAFAVQAETVADYERGIGTFTAGGTCNLAGTVKIHLNTDAINGIQFANSYTSEGVINANYTTVTCEGGFKAGDVISIAGAFNNSDNSKQSAIDIFVPNEDNTANVLFTTQQFINGRSSADDPVVETYTLEEDIDVLYLGRNGNTSTFITVFKVVRGEETPIEPEVEPEPEEGVIFDGGMIAQNKDKEWIDKFGTIEFFGTCSYDGVKVHENVDNLPCILFEKSYKSDNELNTYIIVHPNVEGGFKAGDKISIAGAFNNSDETKTAAVIAFTLDEENNVTELFTTEPFINGRTSSDDPVVEEYVLEEDAEVLYFGRNGNTKTCVTTLKIERGDEPIVEDPTSISAVNVQNNGVAYNLAGQQVKDSYKGIIIRNGKKVLK